MVDNVTTESGTGTLCFKEDCPLNPFSCIEEIADDVGGNLLTGLPNTTDADQSIQRSVEQWRQAISQHLIECDCAVNFNYLSVKVPRPANIPGSIKLKDVLMTDAFVVTCNEEHDLWLVSLSHLNSEVLGEKWKNNIYHYLYKQTVQVPLTRIGMEVRRPTNLPQSTRLGELLRLDLQQRFVMVTNPTNNETVVHVHMSDALKEKYCEKWRRSIIDFITSSKQKHIYLNVLAANVSRPYIGCNVIVNSGALKLKKMLLEDPQNRFKCTGELNKQRVSLNPLLKTEEGWTTVSKKKQPHNPSELDTVTDGLSSYDHHVNGIASRDHPSVMGHPSTMKQHFNTVHSGFAPPGLMKPNSDVISTGYTKMSDGNETSHLTSIHRTTIGDVDDDYFKLDIPESMAISSSSYNISSLDHLPSKRTELPSDHSNHTPLYSYGNGIKDYSEGSNNNVVENIFGRRPSLLSVDKSTTEGGSRLNGHTTWAFDGLHDVLNSCSSTTMNQQLGNHVPANLDNQSASINKPSTSNSHVISSSQPTQHQHGLLNSAQTLYTSDNALTEWLPHVLHGFPTELIKSSCDKLTDEGFITVNDLIIAKQLKQLTYDYLQSEIGFKIGHCNRLMLQLDKVKIA